MYSRTSSLCLQSREKGKDSVLANRIDTKLASIRDAGGSALVPYVTVGYPDVPMSVAIGKTVLESGGDMLELGVPFSDPLADGTTVQMTSFHALQQGVNVGTSLDVIRDLRRDGVDSPLIFLGYLNPFLTYGTERFAKDAAESGLDGVIVPDLPTEESGPFATILEGSGIHLIPLLAPTSSDSRIEQACRRAKGFIYCVSVAGVTGARTELRSSAEELVERVRRFTDLPLIVGFGVSRPEHVQAISRFADGAVVASALLDAVSKAPKDKVLEVASEFVRSLNHPLTGEGVE